MARQSTAATDLIASPSTYTNPARFTIAGWYRPAHVPAVAANTFLMFSNNSGAGVDTGFAWDNGSAGFVGAWYFNDSSSVYRVAQYTNTFVVGQWYFLAGTYDGANLVAWLNGVSNATTASGNPPKSGTQGYEVLGFGASNSPQGVFGEQAVWNVALSANEMRWLASGAPLASVRPGNILTNPQMRPPYNNDSAPRNLGLYTVRGTIQAPDPPQQQVFTQRLRDMLWSQSPPVVTPTADTLGQAIFRVRQPGWQW